MSVTSTHDRRHQIAKRDGWRCNFCTRFTLCPTCIPDVPREGRATLDHIVPKSKGGTDALANLCIACEPCNAAKADGIWPDLGDRPEPAVRLSPGRARRQSNNRYTRKRYGRAS